MNSKCDQQPFFSKKGCSINRFKNGFNIIYFLSCIEFQMGGEKELMNFNTKSLGVDFEEVKLVKYS
jgi:hypothetical protein